MKKRIALFLNMALILSLAACGEGNTSSSDSMNGTESLGVENIRTESSQAEGKGADNGKSENAPKTAASAENGGSVSEETVSQDNGEDPVKALEMQYAGLKEDALTWDYNSSTNTIVISGEGPMRDYREEAPIWDQYSSEAKHVVIGDEVTSVGAGAFLWFSELLDVELGESVEFIGDAAFSNCIRLETVNFPEKLKYVGIAAFNDDLLHSDQGFVFPEGMLYLAEDSFRSAFKESFVSIPASLTGIGKGAFANCFVDEFRVAPENTVYVSENGCLYDKQMTTLINYPANHSAALYEIPEGVTTILRDAIAVTNNLEKIMIPASATVIEEASIYWNYGLAAIEVDGNNKNYISDDGVLYTAQGKLLVSYPPASDRTEYTVMEGCERFGIYSLSQAMGLTELHAGEYLREIGDSALYGSSSLSEIGLPKGLQKINDSAFLFCDALTRVDFSGSSEDWSGIEIGEKNECLTDGSVEIHCAE